MKINPVLVCCVIGVLLSVTPLIYTEIKKYNSALKVIQREKEIDAIIADFEYEHK